MLGLVGVKSRKKLLMHSPHHQTRSIHQRFAKNAHEPESFSTISGSFQNYHSQDNCFHQVRQHGCQSMLAGPRPETRLT